MKLLLLLLIATLTAASSCAQDSFPKVAPYSGVRWKTGPTEVLVDGTWYELVAIDKVTEAELVRHAKAEYRSSWQKRIGEDLLDVLDGLGAVPDDDLLVDLVLKDLTSGKKVEKTDVEMTHDKRSAVWNLNNGRLLKTLRSPRPSGGSKPMGRVDRPHKTEPEPHFAYLAKPVRTDDAPGVVWLSRTQAEEDLDELEWLLSGRYSYWRMKDVDALAAFDAVRAGLSDKVERKSFAIQITKLLALFGDGHTRLTESETRTLPAGYAPFLLGDVDGRVVAFLADRSDLVDPDLPFLVAIDDRPLEEWLQTASRLVADGSPQFVRRNGLRVLRYLQYLRREMGLEETGDVRLRLANDAGEESTITLRLTPSKPIYGSWPRTNDHRRLEGEIGYVRVARMDDDSRFLRGLTDAMEEFKDTRGLIIDVRGNGGGSRDALRALFPYLMSPDDPPYVANVAAYRLSPDDSPGAQAGYLDNRALFPKTWAEWDQDDLQAIDACAASFKPQWTPPDGAFSDWHYMLLERPDRGAVYHYDKPVVVLMNSDCYSATDIFLGAFKGWRNVTLLGEPSGGGSGRSRTLALANSGLRLRASTMASFRSNGRLYDGNGIEPDVLVRPVATDFIGTTDTQLDAALARLRQ